MSSVVTLSLLKLLEQNGFGKIDESLFWEKLGIGRDGIYIADLGGNLSRGERHSTSFELYSRDKDDLEGYQKLQQVVEFLNHSFAICELPAVPPYTSSGVNGVTIMPIGAVTNAGLDADGRVIWSATGQVYHDET